MAENKTHVSVTAIKFHTLDGKSRASGETYDVDADLVASLVAQGMATPVLLDEVRQAKVAPTAAAQAKKKPAAKPAAKAKTPKKGPKK